MRQMEEYRCDSPSEEKSDDNITRIVDTSYDSREAREETKNKKCHSHSRTVEEGM